MKIRKCIQKDDYWFYYKIYETYTPHGLYNDFYSRNPFGIGYHYKHQRKGFWLREKVN